MADTTLINCNASTSTCWILVGLFNYHHAELSLNCIFKLPGSICKSVQSASQNKWIDSRIVSTTLTICRHWNGSSGAHPRISMPAQTEITSCVMDKRKADDFVEKRPSKCSRSYDDKPGASFSSLVLADEDITPFIDVFGNPRAQLFQSASDFPFAEQQQAQLQLHQQQQQMLPDDSSSLETAANTLATRSISQSSFHPKVENDLHVAMPERASWIGSATGPRLAQEGGDEQHIQFRNGSWKIMSAPEPSLPRFIHDASLSLPKSGIFSGIELVILLFYSFELFFEDTPYSIIKKILGTERGRTTLRRKLYKTLAKYDKKVNQRKWDLIAI